MNEVHLEAEFLLDSRFDRQPMQTHHNWSDVVSRAPSSRSAREVVGQPDPILAGFDCAMAILTGSR